MTWNSVGESLLLPKQSRGAKKPFLYYIQEPNIFLKVLPSMPKKRIWNFLSRKKPSLQERHPQHKFGKWTYGNPKIRSWQEGASLRIGSFCSIAEGVKIFLGGEHRIDWVTTFPFSVLWESGHAIEGHPKTKGDVIIGNDVWIGADCVILSGVTIGDGAVLGARTVVARDVPPYAIVAGNPGIVVRKRFDDITIARLLRVKWWEWEDKQIEKALPMLLQDDISSFLDFAEAGS